MGFKFEGADGMGDALDGVGLAVSPVIGGVDRPRITRAVVRDVADAVHHGVAQLHVFVCHVDLCPQHPGAVGELPGAHPLEQGEVLRDAAVTEW